MFFKSHLKNQITHNAPARLEEPWGPKVPPSSPQELEGGDNLLVIHIRNNVIIKNGTHRQLFILSTTFINVMMKYLNL